MTATTLVTGGAGYIGSHTVRAMRASGRAVVVLDTLELGIAEAVIDAPLVVGDIADEALVEQVCRDHQVDTIVHFAAYKNVGESMQLPSKYFHNNVDGTVRLLDAAVRAGVGQVVFSSSCSVYGTPAAVPVDETQAIQPESVYADTKAIVERVLHWYGEVHGLRSVSLRYFNAAGASVDARIGEDWQYSLNLIPVAIRALLLGDRTLKVFGSDYPTPDGTCIRDYIHVDDLADAHIAAIDHLAGGGATTAVNVGTGVGFVGEGGARRDRARRRPARAPRVRRPSRRRPGHHVRRHRPARTSCSAGRRSTASTRSSPRRSGGTRGSWRSADVSDQYTVEVDPSAENNPHSHALRIVGSGHRVLEVGCSTGYVTEHLVAAGNTVVGVELDPEAATLAERFAERVHVADLDLVRVSSIEHERFDVIVLGDVLEHLRDPDTTLARPRSRCSPPAAGW